MPPQRGRRENPVRKKNEGNSTPIMTIILIAIIAIVAYQGYQMVYQSNGINVPFDSHPLSIKYNQSSWGTFRPGVYFGMKTLTPGSLVTGLMWFKNKIVRNTLPIRHWCSQHDGLNTYGWKKHDFHHFGIQDIVDGNLGIRTSFVVKGSNAWSAKVDLKKINESIKNGDPYSLVYYVGTENDQEWMDDHGYIRNDSMHVVKKRFPFPKNEPFFIRGKSFSSGGDFEVSIDVSDHRENVLLKGWLGTRADPPLMYLSETILQNIDPGYFRENLFMVKGTATSDSNWIAHQIIFQPPMSLFIEYSDGMITTPTSELSSQFDTLIQERSEEFDSGFEKKFKLKTKGYSGDEIEIAQSIVSNMIGSVGFFHGYSKVVSGSEPGGRPEPLLYGPHSLLTGVPSRSFFPRGFLWDEGFHGLIMSQFDPELSVQIIKSWLNLMNTEGWIPREVILGPEAEARVPPEFIVQKNTNANPPTFLLTIESLLERRLIPVSDLEEMFPRLQAWYSWYNTSQSGNRPGTYRWRGRDHSRHELNPKTLTSGLDDYPRATHPTIDEYHIDLRCWMALASRVMAKVTMDIGHLSHIDYQQTYQYLIDEKGLTQLHWSDQYNIFCDRGIHSLQVKLIKPKNQPDLPSIRMELSPPEFGCVPEIGYVSLFPFLLHILPPSSDQLLHALNDIGDPSRLYTPYGIRSLSRHSRYYRKYNTDSDPPYWRGAIWIQMNYLALKSLNFYASNDGPHRVKAKQLYDKLRQGVVSNILKEYTRTGYVWETYDDVTGKGQGSHPFTGFSALVVLIMAEEYNNEISDKFN